MAGIIADTGIGTGLLEIASGIFGITLIALLLTKSSQAVQLVQGASGSLGSLLQTATFQGSSFGAGTGFNSTH